MKKIALLLILFSTVYVSAQRYKLVTGDFSKLGNIAEYNVTFDYSDIQVHGFESEAAFLKDKTEKRANVEGKAEQFEKDWFENREKQYEPKFIEYFNNQFPKGETKVSNNRQAKYTMNIKSTWIYPGYFAEPAKLSAIITVTETLNPQNILVVVEFDKATGFEQKMFNGDLGQRISGAYAKLARNITLQLKRFL
ncbi:MAG TPA: hypothetical protein VGB43_02560 [Flavobacterium sp.]